jgi:hypothetical protein
MGTDRILVQRPSGVLMIAVIPGMTCVQLAFLTERNEILVPVRTEPGAMLPVADLQGDRTSLMGAG